MGLSTWEHRSRSLWTSKIQIVTTSHVAQHLSRSTSVIHICLWSGILRCITTSALLFLAYPCHLRANQCFQILQHTHSYCVKFKQCKQFYASPHWSGFWKSILIFIDMDHPHWSGYVLSWRVNSAKMSQLSIIAIRYTARLLWPAIWYPIVNTIIALVPTQK